jgi:hypothetical protein
MASVGIPSFVAHRGLPFPITPAWRPDTPLLACIVTRWPLYDSRGVSHLREVSETVPFSTPHPMRSAWRGVGR